MKSVNLMIFVFLLMFSLKSMAIDSMNADGPKRVFQISYLKEVDIFKNSLVQSLEKLRLELLAKKYPQAYFIKSIQGQVGEMHFRSINDFDNLEEQLFSLLQSVNSQSNANKNLAFVRYDGDYLQLTKLSLLKKKFVNENEIVPSFIYSAPDADSQPLWKKIQGTINEISARDESIIFFTVFTGYLFLVFRRKMGIVKLNSFKVSAKKEIEKKNFKTKKIQKENLSANIQVDLKTLEGVSICKVGSFDQVLYANSYFINSFGKQKNWKTFFNSTFVKDERILGANNLYKLQGEIDSRFLIQTISEDRNGAKVFFLWDISWSTDTNIQKIESVQVEDHTIHDMIESILARLQNFSALISINGADGIALPKESFNYLSIQNVIENYLRIVFQVAHYKKNINEIVLNVDETDKRYMMSAFIPGIQLQPSDLSQKITYAIGKNEAKTMNSIFKAMKTDHRNLAVNFKIKNVFNAKLSGLYLDLSFNKEIVMLPKKKVDSQSLTV